MLTVSFVTFTSSTQNLSETGLKRTWALDCARECPHLLYLESHHFRTTNVPIEFSKLHHTQIARFQQKPQHPQCLPSSSCRTRCIRSSKLIKEGTLFWIRTKFVVLLKFCTELNFFLAPHSAAISRYVFVGVYPSTTTGQRCSRTHLSLHELLDFVPNLAPLFVGSI